MGAPVQHLQPASPLKPWSYREAGDDFFCIRYQVWYPSIDCAIRTRYQTSDGCKNCDQGLFNHKRHLIKLRTYRFPLSR